VSVGGATLLQEENTSPTTYDDTVAYLSSPWSVAATNVEIKNIQLSEKITPCGPTCTFDKNDCPTGRVYTIFSKKSKIGGRNGKGPDLCTTFEPLYYFSNDELHIILQRRQSAIIRVFLINFNSDNPQ